MIGAAVTAVLATLLVGLTVPQSMIDTHELA